LSVMTSRRKRIATLAILILISLAFHLYSHTWKAAPGQSNFMKHVLADLCYIPILVGAIWFGIRGAVLTTTIIAIFSLIFVILYPSGSPAEIRSDYVEIIFFYLVGGVTGIVLDKDRRLHKLLEETQRQAAIYNRSLIEAGLDPLVTIGPDGKITDVNEATEKATGLAREELIGTDFSDYFTEPQKAREGYKKVFDDGFVRDYPLEIKNRDGHNSQVLYNASLYRNESGDIVGIFAAARDISERKKAERALEEHQQRLELALYGGELGSWDWDLITNRVTVNARWVEMTGYALEELEPLHINFFNKLVHPDDREKMNQTVKEHWENRSERYDFEFRIITKSGGLRWINSRGQVIARDQHGQPLRMTGTHLDITERKKAQQEIEDLARFPKENPGPVMRISSENLILYANSASAPVLKAWQTKQGGKLPDHIFDKVMKARSSAQNQDIEIKCSDRIYWFLINRISGDQATSIYGKDITDRKRAEQKVMEQQEELQLQYKKLQASEIELQRQNEELQNAYEEIKNAEEALRQAIVYNRSLFESSLDSLVTIGPDGKITDVNDATEAATGFGRDELIGTDFIDYFTEPDKAHAGYQQVFQEGMVRDYPLEIKHRDNHVIPVLYNASLYRDDAGKVIGILAAARDITERKKMEDALWKANGLLESMFSTIDMHIVYLDKNFNFIRVNRAYAETCHHPEDFFPGKNHFDLYPNAENEAIFREVVLTGKPFLVTAKPLKFPDQPERGVAYWDWSLYPVLDQDGKVGGLVFSLIDVTRRELAAQEIAKKNVDLATVNAELQQFAYVASHDLQEPLRMIASYLQLIEKRYKDKLDQDANDFIAFAVDGATRLQSMIISLLEYSRIETRGANLKTVSCQSALKQALNNLSYSIEENEAIITHDYLPTIMGDGLQLIQLFQNLIGNAIKFRGKEIPQIHITATSQIGEWLFKVRDNGVGIDPQYFDRIFNIFQRLHGREYPGTGIGLALCKRIIERHEGRIWVESELGKGATFCFTLPIGKSMISPEQNEGD
jgi:PAS domain S-box-containing protein